VELLLLLDRCHSVYEKRTGDKSTFFSCGHTPADQTETVAHGWWVAKPVTLPSAEQHHPNDASS